MRLVDIFHSLADFGLPTANSGFVWVASCKWPVGELYRSSWSATVAVAASTAWQLSGWYWIQLKPLAKCKSWSRWPFDIITGHISSNWLWSINFFLPVFALLSPFSSFSPFSATLVALFLICNIHLHLQLRSCRLLVLLSCSCCWLAINLLSVFMIRSASMSTNCFSAALWQLVIYYVVAVAINTAATCRIFHNNGQKQMLHVGVAVAVAVAVAFAMLLLSICGACCRRETSSSQSASLPVYQFSSQPNPDIWPR